MRRVVNQRSVGSLGVDSVAGSAAPPPGYTSQRDTASSIAAINDDEEDVILKNSPLSPPSTESPHRDPLPSPYSIEDLRVRSHEQDQNQRRLSLHQSCAHGYTDSHTTSSNQCTPVRPSSYYPPQQRQLERQKRDPRPLSCDAFHFYSPPQILSTDNLFGVTNEQSRPYYRCSTEEHWKPSVQDNQHQHQQTTSPYTDYSLPTSPYHHPPPLRFLTYPSTDEGHYGCKEYDEEEGNQSSPLNDQSMRRRMMIMNSTATILSPPEEPLGYQQSSYDLAPPPPPPRPSLPNGPNIAINPIKSAAKKSLTSKSSAKAHSTPPPLPLSQTQPTNYVHISRKCNPSFPTSKPRRWRRKTAVLVQPNTQIPPPKLSSSSAITGTFMINPELYIPPSLLNAMEDPVFFRFKPSSDTGETRKKRGSRINLRLEVENGGIDVDIHLVPTTISTNLVEDATCTGQDTFCDTPVQAQASASTSTTAFSGGPPPSTHPRQSTTSSIRMQENPVHPPSGGTFSRKGISTTTPEVTREQRTSSRRDKKKPSRPTTIDLQIKQAYYPQDSLNMQNQDSIKINGPIAFPLIARIHAPNPRPPFHLFASTIDMPATNLQTTTTDSTSNQHTSRPTEPHTRNHQSRVSTSKRTTSIRNSQVYSEPPTSIILNSPPPLPSALPRRRTRRSLSKSKYRPQRISVSSSHGHGGTPIGSISHAPSSSLTPPSQLNLASPPSSSSPSSPLYLHLPRTFRGPLTIHISSGHISDRLRLSEGLEREIALIRESEFSRGYFVGGLGDGGNDINSGASSGGGVNRDQIVNNEKMRKTQLGNYPNKKKIRVDDSELSSTSVSPSSSSSSSSPPASSSSPAAALKGVQGEWYGDRIEILVGSGDVYLQFEDENEEKDDPFFRTRGMKKEVGFWKRVFTYPGFFSL